MTTNIITVARDAGMEPAWAPAPGFYRSRLVRGGPAVAVRIMQDASGMWSLLINGQPTSLTGNPNPWLVPRMDSIGAFATPISEAAYDRLRREIEAAPRGHPLTNPTDPVDLRDAEPLF